MIQNDDVSQCDDSRSDWYEKAIELMAQIPEDLDKLELLKHLQPICEMLSSLPELSAEVFFREKIQPRCNLTNLESGRYIREIARLRQARRDNLHVQHFQYSADFEGLIDLVEFEGECAFLIKVGESVVIRKEATVNSVRLIPPPRKQIPWLLPRANEVLKHFEQYRAKGAVAVDSNLYDDLISYYRQASQLPSEESYHMLVSWTLHSHLIETANYSPFICFYGAPARGKSRTAKAMTYVSYRGVVLESLSVPHIIRMSKDFKGTLFFDVRDVLKKVRHHHAEDCILLRFERGASAVRVLRPSLGAFRDMELYSVFGPTIFATNESVDDLHETRSLVLQMPSAVQAFEQDVTPERALSLRERLTCFRAFHLRETLPECKKPVGSRLGDITRPLIQMVRLARPEAEEMLVRFIQEQDAERKLERSESPDAQLIRAVYEATPEAKNGHLLIWIICNHLNANKEGPSRRDGRWVGRRLRALGFHKVRSGQNGSRAIVFDSAQVQQMALDYGVLSSTSVMSVTSVDGRKDWSPGAVEALKRRLQKDI